MENWLKRVNLVEMNRFQRERFYFFQLGNGTKWCKVLSKVTSHNITSLYNYCRGNSAVFFFLPFFLKKITKRRFFLKQPNSRHGTSIFLSSVPFVFLCSGD